VLRVAILHHWFVTRGGGERVAECLAALVPQADIFTLVHSREAVPASLQGRRMTSSFLQHIPTASQRHRHFMPLYPEAANSLDLREYDLVISSDSGPVKGARLRDGTPHLCYCHSPMRYLYDSFESYRATMSPLTRGLFTLSVPRVRRADLNAAKRVTHFVANSRYVAARIQRFYERGADVVHPPIDLHRARVNPVGNHYLAAGRLVSYKRTELMIEACGRLGRNLRIAGTGPDVDQLKRIVGPETTFLGALSTDALWDEYSRCRALLFAADEDFGMVPLEAQSCGRPVIAYGYGGSLETVRGAEDDPAPTGLFFSEQTAESLADAILRFEARESSFRSADAQAHAASFATPIFLHAMRAQILHLMPSAEPVLASVDEAMSAID
jgi:glycosyltransferase involved in cell wall biosynthesis